MMKRLHKLMIAQYLGPLIISFIIVLFILLMQFVWLYVDDLMGKGLEGTIILELLFYAAASFVPLALPLAILVSSIMTLGGLGENSELIPLKSAGMHLSRILWPLFLMIGLLAVGSFFFSNNIMPVANLKFKSLLWDIREKKPALNIQPGIFYNGIDGVRIRAGKKNEETGELEDILIYDHRSSDRGNQTVISAARGRMKTSSDKGSLILELEDTRLYDERPPKTGDATHLPMVKGTSTKETVTIDLSGLNMARTDEELFSEHYEMLTMTELTHAKDSMMGKLAGRIASHKEHLNNSFKPTRIRPVADDEVLDDPREQESEVPNVEDSGDYVPATSPQEPDSISPMLLAESYRLALNIARNNRNFLNRSNEEIKERKKQISKFEVEWHRKLMLAAACVIFFFIGAPLGSIIRKGGLGAPTVFAIVFFLIFHITSFSTERLVISGKLDAWPGMWISSLILIPIGIYLTYQAATDSPLLDLDSYARIWDKFKRRLSTS